MVGEGNGHDADRVFNGSTTDLVISGGEVVRAREYDVAMENSVAVAGEAGTAVAEPSTTHGRSFEPVYSQDGLRFDRTFTREGTDVYDMFQWERRNAIIINDETGKIEFRKDDLEVPSRWSQQAVNVVGQKYFLKTIPANPENGETSVRQLTNRVIDKIADDGTALGYFASEKDAEAFRADLKYLIADQFFAFNSPVWFNWGKDRHGIRGTGQGLYFGDPNERKDLEAIEETTKIAKKTLDDAIMSDSTPQLVERLQREYDSARLQGVYRDHNAVRHPQGSACFITPVEDEMESILNKVVEEGLLFKYGSGNGTNISPLRSKGEKLSHGGVASGPLSLYEPTDTAAKGIKSGGTTRRAAKMVMLDVDHPDIAQFINYKAEGELTQRQLGIVGVDNTSMQSAAQAIVPGQQANYSVRVTDEFMKAVLADGNWTTHNVTDKAPRETYKARDILRGMARAVKECGDPGIQFDTTINDWHTSPNTARINASNPCSEYMFIDDSACNLASLNLMKFRQQDGVFDTTKFRDAVRKVITAMEIIVGTAGYPTAKIAANSVDFRPLGIGYANLGALMMSTGTPYDSDEGRSLCGAITAILAGEAYAQSARIAANLNIGAFNGFAKNRDPMMRVMRKHQTSLDSIIKADKTSNLVQEAREIWNEAVDLGEKHGYRNSQAVVLAPTGTIAFMMDCATTGIEPELGLVKTKRLAGGGRLRIVNDIVPTALSYLGYTADQVKDIVTYIAGHRNIEGAPHINRESLESKGLTKQKIKEIEEHISIFGGLDDNAPYISGTERKVVDGSAKDVKYDAAEGLKRLGFTQEQIREFKHYVNGHGDVRGAPHFKTEHTDVFRCSFLLSEGTDALAPMSHVNMMEAAQPYCSGAISKTVNCPAGTSEEEIMEVWIEGWKKGLKAIAIYADGSKVNQALYVEGNEKVKVTIGGPAPNKKARLPFKRDGFTEVITIAEDPKDKDKQIKLFVTMNEDLEGRLREIFVAGSPKFATYVDTDLRTSGVDASKMLQYDLPLDEIIEIFELRTHGPRGAIINHPYFDPITSRTTWGPAVAKLLRVHYKGELEVLDKQPERPEDYVRIMQNARRKKAKELLDKKEDLVRRKVALKIPTLKERDAMGDLAPSTDIEVKDRKKHVLTADMCTCGSPIIRMGNNCKKCSGNCGALGGSEGTCGD